MSVTRLKRKHRKNIARANNETNKIKNLLRTPVLKNVDLDELKAKFSQAAPPDVAAKSDKAPVPATDRAAAESQAALTSKLADQPAPEAAAKPEATGESLFDKVSHAASAALDTVKHAASDAVEAVTHTGAYGAVQEAAHNLVEGTKQILHTEEQPQAAAPEPAAEPAKNEEAQVNQTGTEGFDEAEAVTKPVNEDGQEGEHPKPEIHL